MKSKIDMATEVIESVIAFLKSVDNFCGQFKLFANAMIHVRAKLIKENYDELEKYHYDSKFACDDKLSMVLPIQLRKEEIERILDEQEDALIYN